MKNRIKKLRKFIYEKKLDSILITNPINLIYYSGFMPLDISDREAFVLITNRNCYILTSKLYADEVKDYVKDFILKETSTLNTSSQVMNKILKEEGLKTVGFEENNLKYSEYIHFKETLKLIPTNINHLRVEKDHDEMDSLAKACRIGDAAYEFILGKIKPGITEEDLAFQLEIFMREQHSTPSFPSIVAFGKNAAIPHHVTGKEKLIKNNFVLLDFGVKVNNYCSDMTRTVFLGKPTDREKKIYYAVLEAQQYSIEYLRNKYSSDKNVIKASDVDRIARNHILEQGFHSFPHSLGHGIGLQVHEAPSISPNSFNMLGNGMVFSIEPGIYILNETGVRIEDLVALEKNEVKLLTNASKKLTLI